MFQASRIHALDKDFHPHCFKCEVATHTIKIIIIIIIIVLIIISIIIVILVLDTVNKIKTKDSD